MVLHSTHGHELVSSSSSFHCQILGGTHAIVAAKLDYHNGTSQDLTVSYSVPMDNRAAIYSFSAIMGTTKIVAVLKEREEAKATWDKAKSEGKTTALLVKSETIGDEWKIHLGNLRAGETCRLEYTYGTELRSGGGQRKEFHLPTHLAPRYDSLRNPILPTKLFSPGVVEMKSSTLRSMEINVDIEDGCEFKVNCVSYKGVEWNFDMKTRKTSLKVVIPNGELSVDWVVQLEPATPSLQGAQVQFGKIARIDTGYVIQTTLSRPKVEDLSGGVQVEYIFVIDRSGSMDGKSIESVKQCMDIMLRSLSPGCRFNLVCFGDTHTMLFPTESPLYNEETFGKALAHVGSWQADMGGTEILSCFQRILEKLPPLPQYPREIILLTDGMITNERPLLDLVRTHAKTTRVFTIGIGSHVSRSLIEKTAKASQATHIFVADDEPVTTKMMTLFGSIQPAYRDLKVHDWGPFKDDMIYRKEQIGDTIYADSMTSTYFFIHGPHLADESILQSFSWELIARDTLLPPSSPSSTTPTTPPTTMLRVPMLYHVTLGPLLCKAAAHTYLEELEAAFIRSGGKAQEARKSQLAGFCSLHPQHALAHSSMAQAWRCDGCNQLSQVQVMIRRRCASGCDFDVCESCWIRYAPSDSNPKYKQLVDTSLRLGVACSATSFVLVFEGRDANGHTVHAPIPHEPTPFTFTSKSSSFRSTNNGDNSGFGSASAVLGFVSAGNFGFGSAAATNNGDNTGFGSACAVPQGARAVVCMSEGVNESATIPVSSHPSSSNWCAEESATEAWAPHPRLKASSARVKASQIIPWNSVQERKDINHTEWTEKGPKSVEWYAQLLALQKFDGSWQMSDSLLSLFISMPLHLVSAEWKSIFSSFHSPTPLVAPPKFVTQLVLWSLETFAGNHQVVWKAQVQKAKRWLSIQA